MDDGWIDGFSRLSVVEASLGGCRDIGVTSSYPALQAWPLKFARSTELPCLFNFIVSVFSPFVFFVFFNPILLWAGRP